MSLKIKKKPFIIIIAVMVLAMTVFAGCRTQTADKDGYDELYALEVEVAANNSSGIVHVYYPYYTYSLVQANGDAGDHGGISRKELARSIRDKQVDKDVLNKLVELVDKIEHPDR